MAIGPIKRLREGKTLTSIVAYLIKSHPAGMRRSDIQERLKEDLGVGESTGGVNRQLKRLREAALISWDQEAYTYTLPPDFDSGGYFERVVETLDMSTDRAYFLSLRLAAIVSAKTQGGIDDYLGSRYDMEMSENIIALNRDYRMEETSVYDAITRLMAHHNSYVRLRLYKTANESFLRDLSGSAPQEGGEKLIGQYSKNLRTIEDNMKREVECIFASREDLVKQLNERRLSRRMKFLIRFVLNNARPSHVYDGMI
jgi:hypothetical protein